MHIYIYTIHKCCNQTVLQPPIPLQPTVPVYSIYCSSIIFIQPPIPLQPTVPVYSIYCSSIIFIQPPIPLQPTVPVYSIYCCSASYLYSQPYHYNPQYWCTVYIYCCNINTASFVKPPIPLQSIQHHL